MHILEVRLEGFRRFAELNLRLRPGITLLMGRNGAGKTTALEAIRFGLFGIDPGRSSTGMPGALREGSHALVVELLAEIGGQQIRIRRSIGPLGPSTELSGADGRVLAQGSEAVEQALAQSLGLGTAGRLRLVGERLMGGPFGDLQTALSGPDRNRREFFEPLLNLDCYRSFAERTRGLARAAAGELARIEAETQARQGDIKSFFEMSERLVVATHEAQQAGDSRHRAEAAWEQLVAEGTALEAGRQAFEAAQLAHAVANETRRSRVLEAERARAQLDEAERAAALVHKADAAHARWEQLEGDCRGIEARFAERDEYKADIARLEAKLSEGHAAIEAERGAFSERLLESQTRAEVILAERDALRAELELLRSRSRRIEGARNALAAAAERTRVLSDLVASIPIPKASPPRPDQEALQREAEARRAAGAARAAREEAHSADIRALQARAMTADDALARVNEARSSATRLEALLVEARRTLELLRPAMGACPFLQAPCQNIGGASLIDHFERETGIAEARHAEALEAVTYRESRLQDARNAARTLAEQTRPDSRVPDVPHTTSEPRHEPDRPGPRTRPSSRARLPFEDIGHHLFSLAGVIGAIELNAEAETRALIGAVAGVGEAGSVPSRRAAFDPPDLGEIEAAQRLANEGRAALESPPSAALDERVSDIAGRLALAVRKITAAVDLAAAQTISVIAGGGKRAREAEDLLLSSTRELEAQSLERARVRAASKELDSKELRLLDIEIALTERRVRLGGFERLERELAAKRREQETIRAENESYRAHQVLAGRGEACRDEWKQRDRERLEAESHWQRAEQELATALAEFDPQRLAALAEERDRVQAERGESGARETARREECAFLTARLGEMGDVRERIDLLKRARQKAQRAELASGRLADAFGALAGPVGEAVRRQVDLETSRLWRRMSASAATLRIDEGFAVSLTTPGDGTRAFGELSRGEQAGIALALRLALLQQFPALGLLILDEPTAHLDEVRRQEFFVNLGNAWLAAAGRTEQAIIASHDESLAVNADEAIDLNAIR